jgi:hypothetical protein
MKRWEFERAVLASGLPAPARLVLLVLAAVANWPGGRVPAQFGPSLSSLADLTGLSRRAVAQHLNAIEKTNGSDGWVLRSRPTVENARTKKERTQYQLSIPASAPRAPETEVPGPMSSAGDALASAGGALGLVHEVHRASAPGAHNQASSKPSSSSGMTPAARIAVALRIEEEEADRIFKRILAERSPGAPSRYIDRLIETGDIHQFRKTARPAPAYAGPRCQYLAPTDGTGLCARCHMPAAHAKHGEAA